MQNYILDILVAINFLGNIVFFVSAWIMTKAFIDKEYVNPKYDFGKLVYGIMPTLEYLKDQPGSKFISKDSVRRKIDRYQGSLFGKVGNRYYPTDLFFEETSKIEDEIKNYFLEVPFNPTTGENIFSGRL